MAKYSFEDKSFIEKFVSENSLDVLSIGNEEKWQELGNLMNRNWEEIREICRNWKIYQNSQTGSSRELEDNAQGGYQNLDHVIEQLLLAPNKVDDCDVIEYVVNENGQLIDAEDLHVLDATLLPTQSTTSQIDSFGQFGSVKRPLDILEAETNSYVARIFEQQSLQELELKRKEHKEKMMIYKQQLIHGAELHKERMKILRAKLRAVEEKVEDIDNVICNRNLRKKFKSGPI